MMRFRFAWLIYVAFTGLSFAKADAQPFRNLTVDDFQGVPDTHNGENVAYTSCNIEFSYAANKEKNYYRLDFNILVVMNHEKSWLDRNKAPSAGYLAEILKHEQGHYNMAYLEQQELLRTLSHTVFYGDYQKVANNIFNRIDAKYQQLNRDYDDDTQHMINRPQQHGWDMYFKKALGSDYMARD